MRKIIAFLFAVCLVIPLLLASQVAISASSWILDEEFYVNALSSDKVYQAVLSDDLIDSTLRSKLGLPADADTQALREVIRGILNQDYLKEQSTAFVSDLFDYLHGKTAQFKPVIDLTPIKTALSGEKEDEFLAALARTLPVCQAGQTPGQVGGGQSTCKPQGISDNVLIENYLKPAVPNVMKQIPDQLSLGESWQNWLDQQPWGHFAPGMALPAGVVLSVLFLVFVAVCFWYITALIASRNWHARLQWLGWMMVFPSALVFLIGILSQGTTPIYWMNYALQRVGSQVYTNTPGVQAVVEALSISVLSRVSTSFLMAGGICAGLAVGLILWGLATPNKKVSD